MGQIEFKSDFIINYNVFCGVCKHQLAWQVEVQCILGAVQDHPLGARYLRQKVIHHLQGWKA